MSDAILEVRDLHAGYGGPPIVQGASLSAVGGRVTAIVGLNGAGKSTMLKAVAGELSVAKGEVLLEGVNVVGQPPEELLRRGMSYVPQVKNVFPSLSVKENLEMGGFILSKGVKGRIDEMCDLFPDLRMALKRPARTLSGGQRHMLAVARGMMVDPRVLLLDEPTAGLAPKVEVSVWERILAARATGVALVVVDQNVRRALANADLGVVMAMGRNVKEGPGSALLHSDDLGGLYDASVGIAAAP